MVFWMKPISINSIFLPSKLSKPCDDFFGVGTEGQKEKRSRSNGRETWWQRNAKLKIAPKFYPPKGKLVTSLPSIILQGRRAVKPQGLQGFDRVMTSLWLSFQSLTSIWIWPIQATHPFILISAIVCVCVCRCFLEFNPSTSRYFGATTCFCSNMIQPVKFASNFVSSLRVGRCFCCQGGSTFRWLSVL